MFVKGVSEMAILELVESPQFDEAPRLRLVEPVSDSHRSVGSLSVSQRRARRAAIRARRRALALIVGFVFLVAVLCVPSTVFGSTAQSGASFDGATYGSLPAGSAYIVQPGDTLSSIARAINPIAPEQAQKELVAELRSTIITPGERIVIP